MAPVLIVTHLPDREVGLVRDCLHRAGCAVITRNPGDREPLPALEQIAGIVSLGGRQSAIGAGEDPFLAAEVALMAGALARRVPVLGLCLGAQLLAVAAGGEVSYSGSMYAGWPELVCLPAVAEDPVLCSLPARMPVLKWHEDAITALPPQAELLATSDGPGVALYRVGDRAWGSQPHLELTPEMLVDNWLADPADARQITEAGHDLDAFRVHSRAALPAQMAAARPMFEAFGRLARASG